MPSISYEEIYIFLILVIKTKTTQIPSTILRCLYLMKSSSLLLLKIKIVPRFNFWFNKQQLLPLAKPLDKDVINFLVKAKNIQQDIFFQNWWKPWILQYFTKRTDCVNKLVKICGGFFEQCELLRYWKHFNTRTKKGNQVLNVNNRFHF